MSKIMGATSMIEVKTFEELGPERSGNSQRLSETADCDALLFDGMCQHSDQLNV